ncbi:Oidioi.mRNA.OKI2018_I69.XSR.g16680.t1.cds [Oikopleura dioica]|uniref:Oidioi.mRNA.OKI2018_I69.XSR.g16680.t1.cds n=1 Tax=Oikopleura dioica TaxID=34765 RepID=A0ABN7SGY7_OIKDI|nr:Oidioi.mRNA.OKI2018_I69.XSR.g16680.t1.cds [Oikopleura dioica]
MNGINEPALESCTIIRFPENIAEQIRQNLKLESEKLQSLIEKDANDTYYEQSIENRLTVKWNQDKRHCAVKWDDQLLKGRLCDLPTVVEAYKTTDKKTFYKNSSISVEHELVEDTEMKGKKGSKKDQDNKEMSDILPMLSSSEEEDDDDDLDDKYTIDPLDRHLKVVAEGVFADKIKKVQDQAQRTVDEILRFRERRAKKEAELEVARKEEKKENLRNYIEELRRKEDDKTATYHTICEKFKKY